MKRLLAFLLCLVMLFVAGCTPAEPDPTEEPTAATEPTEITEAPTEPSEETEPTETEPPAPETVGGTVLADRTAVVLTTANRDETVDVVGEYDEYHYVVKTEQGYGIIEKRLVRMDGGEAYVQWNGYAYSGAKLYNNYHLLPEGVQELAMNTQILVLDSLGDSCVVQVGETIGYMRLDEISHNYIQYTPGSGSADGGDISLGDRGVTLLSSFVPQSGEVSGSAVVLADGAEIMLGWYDRGETAQIITEEGYAEAKDGWHAVYLEGLCGYIRQNLAAQEGAEPYAEWDGYAHSQAGLYNNYYLTGEPVTKLSANTSVHILCDLGNCYLVIAGDTTGYMDKGQVSETYITYSGSSGGGEWSDPVM